MIVSSEISHQDTSIERSNIDFDCLKWAWEIFSFGDSSPIQAQVVLYENKFWEILS